MNSNPEIIRILKLVETGKITADEAAKLIEALETAAESDTANDGAANTNNSATEFGPRAKSLRIRVSNRHSGKNTVNLTLPLGLVDLALNTAGRFVPPSHHSAFNPQDIQRMLAEGLTGTLLEIDDPEDDQRIIIEAV